MKVVADGGPDLSDDRQLSGWRSRPRHNGGCADGERGEHGRWRKRAGKGRVGAAGRQSFGSGSPSSLLAIAPQWGASHFRFPRLRRRD
ncbi:Os05g0527466 [Oryza sativa Japonica Group]|uniref:Os05g0527466 protein n=1 Tax=Oryza sativa subsp. japonica TaxID=39947 RepID=A0A0P0WPT6_ORYSJ|nr:Os05g0527466 [Oryza sativa Japonica Group]